MPTNCLHCLLLVVVLLLVQTPIAVCQDESNSRLANNRSAPPHSAVNAPLVTSGDKLMERVIAELSARPAMVAKSRFQVEMFGKHLVGSGTYQEMTHGSNRLMRMEIKFTMAGQLAAFQRINDGHHLWLRKDLPDTNGNLTTSVSRVDLHRLSQIQHRTRGDQSISTPDKLHNDASWQWDPPLASPTSAILPAPGSMVHVLTQLRDHFEFTRAKAINHRGVKAILVHGRVQKTGQADTPVGLPGSPMLAELSPASVTVIFGQEDLFPYFIQYHTNVDDDESSQGRGVVVSTNGHPVLTIEYFEVDFPNGLDPRLFIYHAGESAVEDITDSFAATLLP